MNFLNKNNKPKFRVRPPPIPLSALVIYLIFYDISIFDLENYVSELLSASRGLGKLKFGQKVDKMELQRFDVGIFKISIFWPKMGPQSCKIVKKTHFFNKKGPKMIKNENFQNSNVKSLKFHFVHRLAKFQLFKSSRC